MNPKQARSPLARLLQKALIITLVVATAVILATFGPELLGMRWTRLTAALLIIAGLAALAATRGETRRRN